MSVYLVTGATGFLGKNLCIDLISEGHDVYGVGRNRAALSFLRCLGVTVIETDLADDKTINQIERVISKNLPDAMIHCAALTSAHGTYEEHFSANVQATRNITRLAARMQVKRFIHISTPSVYARRADSLHQREDTPLPKPLNSYAKTKGIAEDVVLSSLRDQSIILRPRGIYGEGETSLIPPLIEAAKRGPLPLFRGGHAVTELTHVSDVVTAIRRAIDAPGKYCGNIYNIAGGEALKITSIIRAVTSLEGVPTVYFRPVPVALAYGLATAMELYARWVDRSYRPRLTRYLVSLFAYSNTLDCSKAARDLGWEPSTSFAQGLAQTYPSRATAARSREWGSLK